MLPLLVLVPPSSTRTTGRSLVQLSRTLTNNFNSNKSYTTTSIFNIQRRNNNESSTCSLNITRSFHASIWNDDDRTNQESSSRTRTVNVGGLSFLNDRLYSYTIGTQQQQLQQEQIRWLCTNSIRNGVGTNLLLFQDSSLLLSSSPSTTLPKADRTRHRIQGTSFSTSSYNQDDNAATTVTKKGKTSILIDSMKHRAQCKINDARDKYNDLKDDARETYLDFKDHPSVSAKAGAKSITDMIRLYGPVFIGTYGGIYFITLGTLFTGVQAGVLDPITLISAMKSIGSTIGTAETAATATADATTISSETATSTYQFVIDFMNTHTMTRPYVHIVETYPYIANLGVAWIAVKFTEPIRLGISIYITPRVARYFGYNTTTTGSTTCTTITSTTATTTTNNNTTTTTGTADNTSSK